MDTPTPDALTQTQQWQLLIRSSLRLLLAGISLTSDGARPPLALVCPLGASPRPRLFQVVCVLEFAALTVMTPYVIGHVLGRVRSPA
jgi:hypothetical protein